MKLISSPAVIFDIPDRVQVLALEFDRRVM